VILALKTSRATASTTAAVDGHYRSEEEVVVYLIEKTDWGKHMRQGVRRDDQELWPVNGMMNGPIAVLVVG
jgi:hypothetical protein